VWLGRGGVGNRRAPKEMEDLRASVYAHTLQSAQAGYGS